jgi:hypothetical protein
VNKEVAKLSMALLIPVISQYVTAPLHIHAMDIYARPVATAAERVRKVVEEYNESPRGRCVFCQRSVLIVPNNKLRDVYSTARFFQLDPDCYKTRQPRQPSSQGHSTS